MTTVKQYTTRLRSGTNVVARKFGTDLNGADKTLRAALMGVLVMLAVVIKVLVDNSVMTDAELIAEFDAAEADTQQGEPDLP